MNLRVTHWATERERLENNLFDAEIHLNDTRDEYCRALRNVKVARALLEHHDYIESIREQFGPEIANQVEMHSAVRRDAH